MTAPFFTQRQHIAVKVESSEGVDAVPADADVVYPAFDIGYTPNFEMNDRETMADSFSPIKSISGERSGEITFQAEIKGSGAAGTAPGIGVALRACGFAETIATGVSVTYAPASESLPSVTVEIREGSTDTTVHVKKLLGCRGTVTMDAEKGGIFLATFTFTGVYVEPTEAAAQFLTPAETPDPEPFLSAAFSFLGVSTLKIQSFSADMANSVSLRNDVSAASGNVSALIVGRSPTGSINPELTDIATENFFNELTTNAVGVLTFTLGTTAGNITVLNAPTAQIVGIAEGDRDAIRTEDLDLKFSRNADIGDDELTLAFT